MIDEVEFLEIRTRVFVTVNGRRDATFDNVEEARARAAELKIQWPNKRVRLRSAILEEVALVESPPPPPPPPTTTTTAPATTTTASSTTAPTTTSSTTAPTTTSTTAASTTTTTAPPPPPNFEFVKGKDDTAPVAGRSKPAIAQTLADPAYGLDVTRLTSAAGTRFNRNTYSRRQAENADGSLFFTYHGDAEYRVYSVADGSQVAVTNLHPDAEPQWHPTDPNKLRHTTGPNSYTGTLTLRETDVRTGQETVLRDLTEQVQELLPGARYLSDGAEGSPSADGNRYAWMIFDGSEQLIGAITYDLASDEVLGVMRDLPSGVGKLDAISISPSGQFVLAQWWDTTAQFNVDFSGQREILPGAEHSDIAIGANGNDTYVYIDFTNSERAGWVVAYDMVTGDYRKLINLYDNANTSIHISGKAYNQPGWAVLSTYSCKVDGAWTCHKVMAVDLENATVLNLAHTYNCGDNYWTETHAVANRDLSRIYFNSDFGSCGIDAEVYRIDVPDLP